MKNKPQIKWSEEKKTYLELNYGNGDLSGIAKYLGVSKPAIKSMARLMELKSDFCCSQFKLLKLCDDNNFNNYWYGFIIADGHLTNKGVLRFTLNKKDDIHLKILADYLEIKLSYKKYVTTYGESETCKLDVSDSTFGKVLFKKLNIIEPKTYNPVNLNFIKNNDMFLSFLAGIIDGDGCLFSNNKGVVNTLKIEVHKSWVDNLTIFKKELLKIGNFKITISESSKGYGMFRISNSTDIIMLKKYFKKLNLPLMSRKWDKVSDVLNYTHQNQKKFIKNII